MCLYKHRVSLTFIVEFYLVTCTNMPALWGLGIATIVNIIQTLGNYLEVGSTNLMFLPAP